MIKNDIIFMFYHFLMEFAEKIMKIVEGTKYKEIGETPL